MKTNLDHISVTKYADGQFTFKNVECSPHIEASLCTYTDLFRLATYVNYYHKSTGKPLKQLDIFKHPVTDSGMKKSARGRLMVDENLVLHDEQSFEDSLQGELKVVFLDGKLVRRTSLGEIRERLA